jgi:hypothetical protein
MWYLIACISELASSLRDPQAHLDHKVVLNRIYHHIYLRLIQQYDRGGQIKLIIYAPPSRILS